MSLLTDQRRSTLGFRFQVIGFVLVVLLLGALGVSWIGISAGVYVPRTSLYFTADSGQDIRKGMAIKLSGFRIGTVEALALDDSARVLVGMKIEDRYLKFIKKNSTVRLAKENLIGDGFLDISRGSDNKAQVKPGDQLSFEPGRDLGEIAGEIRDRVMPVVDQLEAFLRYINDPSGDIRRTIAELHTLATAMNGTRAQVDTLLARVDGTVATVDETVKSTRGNLDHLLKHSDQAIVAEAGNLLRALNTATTDTNRIITRLDRTLPGILEDLGRTTRQVRRTVDGAAPQVSGLVDDGREIAGGARSMVDGLLSSWPFNTMTKPPETGLSRFNSHD
ncbi:phospholipid/cholesterol/gamma-HCH transport system substrate-binding protein [Gammaproteobacteria bacterium]